MEARRIERTHKATKEQRLTSPPEEILKRLEHLERRMARLEAAMDADRPLPQASNAEAFRSPTASAASPATVTMPDPRVVAPVRPLNAPAPQPVVNADVPQPGAPAIAPTPPTSGTSATADAPITLRLSPAQAASDADAFPDLSLLDEKVDPKKGPAELLDVRASLEDYPRISARIQQLWGSPECEGYLNNLVIDTRGNRKGFPPPMMEELLYLGRLARALVILSVGGDLWDAYDQIGDRR